MQPRQDEFEGLQLGFVADVRLLAGEPARYAGTMHAKEPSHGALSPEGGDDVLQLDPGQSVGECIHCGKHTATVFVAQQILLRDASRQSPPRVASRSNAYAMPMPRIVRTLACAWFLQVAWVAGA